MGRKKILNPNQVIEAIQSWIIDHGNPPTLEELRRALKVGSKRTVQRYLDELHEAGLIDRWPGARGLKLRHKPQTPASTRAVPIVGVVTAGPLTQAEEHIEAWMRLPTTLLEPASSQFFLLRVHGDSMNRATVEGATIEDGDLILVRNQRTAGSGDTVVALVDNETNVKRLVEGPGYWILRPESDNPEHQPILLESEFAVQGVVTKVIKDGSRFIN